MTKQQFSYSVVEDPQIFEQNRLAAHSDHLYFSDISLAREALRRESLSGGLPAGGIAEGPGDAALRMTLNGAWKFHYAENYGERVRDFEKNGEITRGWESIRVPAHLQMEGYGVPQYVNTQYPWDGREALVPGQTPRERAPIGQYVRTFRVPESMRGRTVCISFQGAESAIALWLNGSYVGYAEDAFTPSEFDLTPYLDYDGENRLAVMVFRFTASCWCEDQDFYRFSGIFREVYLYAVPKVHIRDLRVNALLDDEYRHGRLELLMTSTGHGEALVTLERGGERVAQVRTLLSDDGILPFGEACDMGGGSVILAVADPAKWSAEDPALYDLTIEVFDEEGKATETVVQKVGFRRFELKDGVMCLNGKRIVFRGVNRHEFSARRGRIVTDEETLQDILTMKRANINAVRTSHYPNRSVLYRLCDRYGLYMIDETNLECHGVWDAIVRGYLTLEEAVPGDREEFAGLLEDRARSMFERDKNHPAILIWSLGNESLGGSVMQRQHDIFREWDKTRLVHYEGVWWDRRYPDTTDMVTSMYNPAAETEEYLARHREKPYIHCEYVHAMGNSCGAMHKYVELSDREPLYQGGFIWDYIDQGIALRDRFGRPFTGYGGDCGERPHDGSFSGDGIVYGRDRDPSPKLQEVKACYQPVRITVSGKKIGLFNRMLFTDTADWKFVITLEEEGKILDRREMRVSCPPGQKALVPIPFAVSGDGPERVVTASFILAEDTPWAPAGHEIAWGQGVYGRWTAPGAGKAPAREENVIRTGGGLTIIRGWWNVGVRGEGFEALFSDIHGGLISYRYGGHEWIMRPPKPNFWRPMTENDTANLLPQRAGQWKLASMYGTWKTEHGTSGTPAVFKERDGGAEITYTVHLPVKPERDCRLIYFVRPDGRIDVTLEMDPAGEVGPLPEFGVLFTLSPEMEELKWYGRGPEETYADRCHAKLGVYAGRVEAQMAQYLVPQESGNHTDVRWAEVTDIQGRGLRFEAGESGALSFSALPWDPHQIDCAAHPTELPPVQYTFVRAALAQMGVGGDNTWGALTHPEYCIESDRPLRLTFSFIGI